MNDKDDVPTLYEWAGGDGAFERLTAIFYEDVLKDPLLRPLFENMLKSTANASPCGLQRYLEAPRHIPGILARKRRILT